MPPTNRSSRPADKMPFEVEPVYLKLSCYKEPSDSRCTRDESGNAWCDTAAHRRQQPPHNARCAPHRTCSRDTSTRTAPQQ